MACLVAANALEANTLRPLPLGNIARQIHGDNELWLAMMLTNPAVQASVSADSICLSLFNVAGDHDSINKLS